MTTRPWTCVLFDLDGTITDSASGITASLIHTLEQLGRPVPTPAELTEFIGPPIMDGFAALGIEDPERHRALDIYRARYHEHGAFDSSVYPGVPEVIRAVKAAGIPLAVATSKPETQAIRILKHYGLDDLFVFIGGASDDETRSEKVDVVAWVLAHLDELGVDHSNTVMVGDRSHDVIGAGANGIPTISVEWGYGSLDEWVGAIAVAKTPAQLQTYLLDGV
ncbi:HAD hydrolase-like protein [Amnibacterium flavum]|uniref:HAD hydrolase-like protein n=1 Tax=Amnibacterium flavum TaxID=2173173 RepID=UPI001F0CC9E4|nr:HAD hydrolase-like protein [Amnibacterium flavum]